MKTNSIPTLDGWAQPASLNDTLKFIKEVALPHALQGGVQGSHIAKLIADDDFPGLCGYELDYDNISVPDALNCRQALAFYTKMPDLPLGVNRRDVAVAKFKAAEARCAETNSLFEMWASGRVNLLPDYERALRSARSKIARVLGELPRFSDLQLKFGPGATTLTRKSRASYPRKIEDGFSCSEDFVPYAQKALEQMPHWTRLHANDLPVKADNVVNMKTCHGYVLVNVTPGRVGFVPKNAKTDRSVVVEGSLNVIVQGAIGRYMTARLGRYGIDLKDQSINQKLAAIGSLTGELATLDLVSASDMMAIAIVRELLPHDWFYFLSSCRSSKVLVGKELITQEKFSSMGNGYTFPLQSLIFWALASSVTKGIVSVYGDDIICETRDAQRVMSVLELSGFEVNRDKSYWTGSFRESCGADYFKGFNIRPWYCREAISWSTLYRLHNFYVRRGLTDCAAEIAARIPVEFLIYGPDGYGDGHLLGAWLPRRKRRFYQFGFGGYTFESYKLTANKDSRLNKHGEYEAWLYNVSVRGYTKVEWSPSSQISLSKLCLVNRPCVASPLGASYASLNLDTVQGSEGTAKQFPMPGTNGYRKVSIYTFDATVR